MTECKWELGIHPKFKHVTIRCNQHHGECAAWKTIEQAEAMLNAAQLFSAEDAVYIAEQFEPQCVPESLTGGKLAVLRAYAKTRGDAFKDKDGERNEDR